MSKEKLSYIQLLGMARLGWTLSVGGGGGPCSGLSLLSDNPYNNKLNRMSVRYKGLTVKSH